MRTSKSEFSKLPHIGWTQTFTDEPTESWQKHLNNAFYYIHSYSVEMPEKNQILATIERNNTIDRVEQDWKQDKGRAFIN